MSKPVLRGMGGRILTIPRDTWESGLEIAREETTGSLRFMTQDHHRVRYFVVEELVRTGNPIDPETISHDLLIPLQRVGEILHELESNLFFLVRNHEGLVTWAFPVTVEPTPHRLEFRSGERLWGA